MTSTITSGPDRSWIPSQSDYFSHNSEIPVSHADDIDWSNDLPAEFPKTIVNQTAWVGADFENDPDQSGYSLVLNDAHVLEIEQASQTFKGMRSQVCEALIDQHHMKSLLNCPQKELGLPFEYLSTRTFPLPRLASQLRTLAKQLTSGVGFLHISGLDPRRYSSETNIIIYVGISSYIGGKRGRQDELGNMLLHLTDLTSEVDPDNERQAPYSNVGQPFHTDTGDIIGLYSLSASECGGESQLASCATIYNEIVRERPGMVQLFSSPSWFFDRFGQWPPYTNRPILFPASCDRVLFSFARRPLVGNATSPRSPGIPDISSSHVEAINFIQFTAERTCLSLKLCPGELLFWNNLELLHCRTGFTDSPDRKRHLLRLWLRNESTEADWNIPEQLEPAWNDAFDHAGRPQLWPIEPIRDQAYIFNQQRSSGHA